MLEGLETDNPLPASVEVTLGQERLDQEGFKQFAASFRENPAVESIQYDRGLVGQAAALFHFFGSVGLGAAALLLLLAAFIITNTIRLMLYARRHEIVIMRMVGATAGFVIAPCLIEGCALGLLGAVAGLVVLYFLFLLLTGLLAQLELVRAILPQLTFLPWYYVFLVILMGVAVGAAGSFMAVRRLADE